MRTGSKIIVTISGLAFLLAMAGLANAWVERGANVHRPAFALYLTLGLACTLAAMVYLKRKRIHVGDNFASWLLVCATGGICVILIWPLLLPILIWVAVFLPRQLEKLGIAAPADSQHPAPTKERCHEEKVEFLRQLSESDAE